MVVSYNILGVENTSKHPDLYYKVPHTFLKWERRKKLIHREIHRYDAGILCFQVSMELLSMSLMYCNFKWHTVPWKMQYDILNNENALYSQEIEARLLIACIQVVFYRELKVVAISVLLKKCCKVSASIVFRWTKFGTFSNFLFQAMSCTSVKSYFILVEFHFFLSSSSSSYFLFGLGVMWGRPNQSPFVFNKVSVNPLLWL